MGIMLGNLSVTEIEKRLGIEFPEDIREVLNNTQQENANAVAKGKWHCFDIPFTIVFGDTELATKVYESVKARSSEVKERLAFSIQN